MLTTDRRIRYQQNLKARHIALVVLTGSTRWSVVRQHAERIAVAVQSATPGGYAESGDPLRAETPAQLSNPLLKSKRFNRVRALRRIILLETGDNFHDLQSRFHRRRDAERPGERGSKL
jgi:hypothetical protein